MLKALIDVNTFNLFQCLLHILPSSEGISILPAIKNV